MKLSEAIRLGSMSTGQSFGPLQDEDGNTCALGAALLAVGGLEATFMPKEWNPVLRTAIATCPDCGKRFASKLAYPKGVFGAHELVIAHLNDTHEWSREAIADWVETIERAQAQTDGVRELQEQPMEPANATTASFAQK